MQILSKQITITLLTFRWKKKEVSCYLVKITVFQTAGEYVTYNEKPVVFILAVYVHLLHATLSSEFETVNATL